MLFLYMSIAYVAKGHEPVNQVMQHFSLSDSLRKALQFSWVKGKMAELYYGPSMALFLFTVQMLAVPWLMAVNWYNIWKIGCG